MITWVHERWFSELLKEWITLSVKAHLESRYFYHPELTDIDNKANKLTEIHLYNSIILLTMISL